MELLFHTIASLTSKSLLLLGMQFPDLSLLTAIHFFFKQSLVLCSSTFKLRWFLLVPCWISFPTPIPMLHSDLECENHTTSKMTIFTKSLHFYTQLCFGLWCQLQPSVGASLEILENFSIGRSQCIQRGTLGNLRISFLMHHSSFLNFGFD